MKGSIFNFLQDMVEENFSLEVWDAILENAQLDGVYVSSETYDDQQLFRLVESTHRATGIEQNALIHAFGKYSFCRFQKMHPDFCNPEYTVKKFLLTVDEIIHVEVKKLHSDVILPSFEYIDEEDKELVMLYRSPRKLCMLAEGLISGAANYYNAEYLLTHDTCMHSGDDHCKLHITVK